jgi:hypothetical protein
LLAGFWKIVSVWLWLVMTLHLFDALRPLGGTDYWRVFDAERLQALARLSLDLRFESDYVVLPFGSLASTGCGYGWFKSRFLSRAQATFGIISWAFCMEGRSMGGAGQGSE